jgi:hypothetical protein
MRTYASSEPASRATRSDLLRGVKPLVRERAPLAPQRLAVGPADDKYEQEADRVADQIVSAPASGLAPSVNATSTPSIQRMCSSCEHEDEKLRGKPSGPSLAAAPSVAQHIGAESGRGAPLPAAARAFFEPRFGLDLAAVRVHDDARAHELSSELRAEAFTVGHDIYFNRGRFVPDTNAGRRLIAHELTHVVQQRAAPAMVQRQVSDPAPTPRSANKSIDPTALSDTELANEINSIRRWLRAQPASSAERESMVRQLDVMGHEVVRRFPEVVKAAGGSSDPPIVLGLLSAQKVAQAEEALAAGRGVATAGRAAATAGRAATTGAGATLAAIGAFLLVLFWPRPLNSGESAELAKRRRREFADQIDPDAETDEHPETKAKPETKPAPETKATPEKKAPPQSTCATAHPELPLCLSLPLGYTYFSPREALDAMKAAVGDKNLSLHNPDATTGGPCPGLGTHYNVRSRGKRVGSIVCCPCCSNTPQGPITSTRCRIIW